MVTLIAYVIVCGSKMTYQK